MSTANTTTQAVTEFLADIDRLHPDPDKFKRAIEQAVTEITQNFQQREGRRVALRESFLEANKTAFDAHVVAEEAALSKRKK